jgi:hypothetical protein
VTLFLLSRLFVLSVAPEPARLNAVLSVEARPLELAGVIVISGD